VSYHLGSTHCEDALEKANATVASLRAELEAAKEQRGKDANAYLRFVNYSAHAEHELANLRATVAALQGERDALRRRCDRALTTVERMLGCAGMNATQSSWAMEARSILLGAGAPQPLRNDAALRFKVMQIIRASSQAPDEGSKLVLDAVDCALAATPPLTGGSVSKGERGT
jgi:hypothetical protein